MKVLFLLSSLFFCLLTQAKPPIEGGHSPSLSTFDYVDMIKLDLGYGGTCSSTRVKDNLILTAAHCVLSYENKKFIPKIKEGNIIGLMGKVIKISVHPLYQKTITAYGKSKAEARKILSHQKTLYDIAFIEFEKKETKRNLPYPEIITSATKFNSRKKVELAGFGSTRLTWGNHDWNFSEGGKLQVAQTEWVTCPQNFFTEDLKKIETLTKDVSDILNIKSIQVHEITSGEEKIKSLGGPMISAGDSGSPAIERDINGKMIITGVASNIAPLDLELANPSYDIYQDGELIYTKELEEVPSNWGYKNKDDLNFKEIKQVLTQKDLIAIDGRPKKNIRITRKYTRVTEGHFADLSHPENQNFIKDVFDETK